MPPVMYMKWGENGPESSPQSVPGDDSGAWLLCMTLGPEDWAEFDPRKQTVMYVRRGDMIYERLVGDNRPNYADLRRREYPSLADQLDALWKGGVAAEEMREQVMAVKEKYPKPV
jgi:hypothetical protein